MLELISIHIPKTGGTSFYQLLQQAYGAEAVSISYKRKHYMAAMQEHDSFLDSLPDGLRVLHGHLRYPEVADLHRQSGAKAICWLRDPVERVISNHRFFLHRLRNPHINPRGYALNKHRVNESLTTYAARPENRNVISRHLEGIALEELAFVGFLHRFEADLHRLAQLLGWPPLALPHLNQGALPKPARLSEADLRQLRRYNQQDIELYQRALSLATPNLSTL